MKKIVLSALLFATLAAAAHAHVQPKFNTFYSCNYTNYSGLASDPGFSIFESPWISPTLLRGIERFQVPYLTGWDNQKVTFAKPVDILVYGYVIGTQWEFTVNPGGPQCKDTRVTQAGNRIDFLQCTDGHSRVCTTY